MIINNSADTLEITGDIKVNKVSIDANNLDFITTLLSSNLYSKPEESFLREIVSNAWDSHVEAKNTDTPILIEVDSKERTIAIRDYGTGISPERFESIYLNIGSSTKRASNEYIGAFGLGRFSSLSCSNTTLITSYYDGIKFTYLMAKEGNSITINLVNKAFTTEHNGVEVKLLDIKSFDKFVGGLHTLVFFPNIYYNDIYSDILPNWINKYKIKRYDNFAINVFPEGECCVSPYSILLGNVLYPIDMQALGFQDRYYNRNETEMFLDDIQNSGISLKFDIGDLQVTPNREDILYNETSINVILDKIRKVRTEIKNRIVSKVPDNIDNIYDFCNIYGNNSIYYNYYLDEISAPNSRLCISFSSSILSDFNKTYKGNAIRAYDKYGTLRMQLAQLRDTHFPGFRYYISISGMAYSKNDLVKFASSWRYRHSAISQIANSNNGITLTKYNDKKVMLKNCKKISEVTLRYLRENFKGYSVYMPSSLDMYTDDKNSSFYEDAYNYLIDGCVELDIKEDPTFLKYKKEYLDSLKSEASDKVEKEYILYVYEYERSYNYMNKKKQVFSNFDNVKKYLKGIKQGILLLNIPDADYPTISIAKQFNYLVITASKDTLKKVMKLEYNNFVPLYKVFGDNKNLRAAATFAKYEYDKLFSNYTLLVDLLPRAQSDELVRFRLLYDKLSSTHYMSFASKSFNDPNEVVDEYTENFCKKLYALNEAIKEERNIFASSIGLPSYIDISSTKAGYIVGLLLLRNKHIRISYNAFNEAINNPLIKLINGSKNC